MNKEGQLASHQLGNKPAQNGLTLVDLKSDVERSRWDSFVRSHPRGTFFHLSPWIEVLVDTYGYQPLLYCHLDSDGQPRGVCPFVRVPGLIRGPRLVSLSFSDYCGPLFEHHEDEAVALREIVAKNSTRAGCIEIRARANVPPAFQRKDHYRRYILDLQSGISEVKRRLDKRTIHYSIRKAEKAGVRIREDASQQGLTQFVKLNAMTRAKHGVPAQPPRFFQNLYELIIAKGDGFTLLAEYDSVVVAAGVFLKAKNAVYYKYNASDPTFLTRCCPNHLLTWHAIEKAANEGYRWMDFGRAAIANAGLGKHKEMWGATGTELPYYYFPRAQGAASEGEDGTLYRLKSMIWRVLPSYMANLISSRFYKYFG